MQQYQPDPNSMMPLLAMLMMGGMGAGGGIPSPEALQYHAIQQNAQLPAAPTDPSTLTQQQALPPGATAPQAYRDPAMETPEAFSQDYARKQQRDNLILGGIGGLAGLLTPQWGPLGYRSWAGQLGSGLQGGLQSYLTGRQINDLRNYRQGVVASKAANAPLNAAKFAEKSQVDQAKLQQAQERIQLGHDRVDIANKALERGNFKLVPDDKGNLWSYDTRKPLDPSNMTAVMIPGTNQQMQAPEVTKYQFVGTDAGIVVGNIKTGTASAPLEGPGGVPLRKPVDEAAHQVKVDSLYTTEHPLKGHVGYTPKPLGKTATPDGDYPNVPSGALKGKHIRVIDGRIYDWD